MATLVIPVTSGLEGCWLAGVADSITETSGAVSQWNDLSGNGRHFKQSSAGNRPTKSTVFEAGAIDFAPSSFLSLDSVFDGITGDAYTVAMVASLPSWSSGYRGLSLQSGASKYFGVFDLPSFRQAQLSAGSGSTSTPTSTAMAGRQYFVAAGRAGTGSGLMRVNGLSFLGTDSSVGNFAFQTLGRYDALYGGFGSVAALMVWSRRLSGAEIASVESFFADLVASGGPYRYSISGAVEGVTGLPVPRLVRAITEHSGAYVGGVVSSATTGAYEISTIYPGPHTLNAYPGAGEDLPALTLRGVLPV